MQNFTEDPETKSRFLQTWKDRFSLQKCTQHTQSRLTQGCYVFLSVCEGGQSAFSSLCGLWLSPPND